MNATELYLKDGRSAGIFFCEKCKIVAHSKSLAEQCCNNYKCQDCGNDTGSRLWLVCDRCRDMREIKREQERYEKADKVTEWAGWVFDGSDYFESIDDMAERYEDDSRELPDYVWACECNHFVHADVSDITERMADNAYEDWEPDTLAGLNELKSALGKFNDQNKDVCSYSPDYTKAVLIKQSLETAISSAEQITNP